MMLSDIYLFAVILKLDLALALGEKLWITVFCSRVWYPFFTGGHVLGGIFLVDNILQIECYT